MTDNLIWSIVLSVIGIAGLLLAGSKYKLGWLLGFGVQALWIIFAIVTAQYGFILSAVVYGVVYARNWLRWRREEREGTGKDSFVFEENELPEVIEESTEPGHLPSSRFTHYRVGSWAMETSNPDPFNESDDNPTYARNAILSWIAWYRHITKPKES